MPAGDASAGGLTLAQYAAVRAATAEPFLLDEVLGVERIDADVWESADLAWSERLASDASMMAEYETVLAAAEDRFDRKVAPIGSDLEAWLAFLLECDASEAAATLDKYKLGVNDLARLSRGWSKRFKAEPALQKRAAEIRKRGPQRLAGIIVGERILRASGLGAVAAAASGAGAGAAITKPLPIEIDRYARVAAELLAAPGQRAAVLARFELSEPAFAVIEAAFRERLHGDPVMASDFARLRDHHRARIAARPAESRAEALRPPPVASPPLPFASPSPPFASPPVAIKPAWSIDEPGTALADIGAILAPVLPFREEPTAALDEALLAPPPSRPIRAGAGSDGATVALPSPFADREIDEETTTIRDAPGTTLDLEDPPTLMEPETPAAEIHHAHDATAKPVPSPFADKPLPFASPPKAMPLSTARPEPAPVRLDSGTVTGVLSPFVTGAQPPFARDRKSVAPLPPPKPPPKRTKTPRVGELHAPRPMPPPSQRAPVSSREPLSSPTPLAAPASTRARSTEPPPMSLEQHAALCVEIAIHPGQDAEVLARNGVDAALKDRADRFWKDLAASDPAIRAAWTRAFDGYHAMFRGRL